MTKIKSNQILIKEEQIKLQILVTPNYALAGASVGCVES